MISLRLSTISFGRFAMGLTFAIVGAILFSSKAIFIKLGYAVQADTLDLLFLRVIFAAPVFIAIALLSKKGAAKPLDKRVLCHIAILGFLGYYIASVFDFYGLKYIAANLERLILYLYPTFVLIFGRLFFKRSVTKSQFLSIGLTYLGICMVVGLEQLGAGSLSPLKGAMLVGVSTLSYACYILFSGEVIPKVGPTRFTALVMLSSTFFLCVHYVAMKGFFLPVFDRELYGICLALAIVCTIIPTVLLSNAIHFIGSANTALAGGVGPASTIVLAHIFLGETLSRMQFLGVGVVMIGVYALVVQKQND